MPSCLKCGTELAVNDEGVAPVLCDRCAGAATGRARRAMALGGLGSYPVTAALMAINIVAFLLEQVPGLNVKDWGVNYGPLTISGEYWRLVTAGFLHADIIHIALNMWCLWSLGRLSERLFGKWQTFAIYMVTGVGGAILSIANNPQHGELGASGAVFGIVGAVIAGVKFGDLDIPSGEKKAVVSSALSFAVLNFVLGLSGNFGVGMFANVDNMCHLGGFITGLMVGLPLGAFIRNKPFQVATLIVTSAVLAVGMRELVQKNGAEAYKTAAVIAWHDKNYAKTVQMLEKYSVARPDDDIGLVMLGEAYSNNNEPNKAIGALEQALRV
ncbi:MAG TPA: rhomboid family intramembrane serine protease, partial [Candidatus Elarobacter sp.]|nr:rhomboid family intramembrane serine protease [Candidatus Elarobacter sp.]